MDTKSGMINVLVDGYKLFHDKIDFFQQSANLKPKNLSGKLALFKSFFTGLWYNARGRISNVQIFSRELQDEEMIHITGSNEIECIVDGDYLSWENMQWENTGDVVQGEVETEEICESKKSSMVVMEPIFLEWES